jgi:ribosome biogenesis GTPase
VPLVVVNKADLGPADAVLEMVTAVAPGVSALAVSGRTGEGVENLRDRLRAGLTAVFLGSSGVGKSTLVNRLLDADLLRTRKTHRSGRGRHTTSHRQLVPVPGGGVVIDTPGLREVQLWAGQEALDEVFEDVERLASGCRFDDCRHEAEPGCAVQAALREGTLDAGRWAGYRKLNRELRWVERRADARLRAQEQRRWRQLSRQAREWGRGKRG